METPVTVSECVICYRDAPDHPTATPCGHIFCRSCLYSALQVKRHCPICRKRVSKRQLVEVICSRPDPSSIVEPPRDERPTSSSETRANRLELKCVKCSKAAKHPELGHCGHAFCRACAHLWYEPNLRCPVHERDVNRRRLIKLFCEGNGCASARNSARMRLPSLTNSSGQTTARSRDFSDDDDASTTRGDDDDYDTSTTDSDEADEAEILLISRFILPFPTFSTRDFPILASSPFAFLRSFARNPVVVMQTSFLPRIQPPPQPQTQPINSNSQQPGPQQQQRQQPPVRRRSFFPPH